MKEQKYIKNPFNYIGAKYKLLDQLFPLFPKDCDTILDLFGGSGEVGLNSKFDTIIYNEKSKPLVNIIKNFDQNFVQEVENCIATWNLSKVNKQEFLTLREYYNKHKSMLTSRENAVMLYCLILHSFNYQISFNSRGEYKTPAGYNRSWFNPKLKEKLITYIETIQSKNIHFLTLDFNEINIENINSNTFVYCDPPYLVTVGAYERDYFCKWSENKEKELLKFLDALNAHGIKFALSNVLEHKGKTNNILIEWSQNYNVHHLNSNYKNCNYQTNTAVIKTSDEVLITNY